MKPIIRSITFLVATYLFFSGVVEVGGVGEGDRINMAVSPIRDEFTVSTGGTTTRQVTFYNNADVPYNVYITTEDCEPGSNYGTPICHPATSTGIDSTKSSTWITPEVSGIFTIGPNSSRVLSFTVNVPDNAGPGGHYGAIFFNNPTGSVTGNAVNMNRRIGMLYLMTVRGQIIVNTNLGDILIDAGGGGAGNSSSTPLSIMTLFSAPSSFFAEGYKRFMMVFDDPEQTADLINEISPIWEKPVIRDENFLVSLKVPVENTGNTHIKPTGKIYLYDGETRLEKIGKQSIVDDNGVYFGEKIVDFLPINDEGGNVLPNTERTFTIDWAGFAFNDIDPETGKRIVGFESPSAYYSRTAGTDAQFLLPWERLSARTIEKELQAKVEVTYINPITGLNEVYTLELPVPIHYTFIAKTINWSALILILLILLLLWMIRNRNKKIHVLEDETHYLEDEIHVLERAQKAHSLKKKETSSNSKKEDVKKAPVKKTPSVKKEAKPTPPPTEKKTVKKVTKAPAKPRVKKEIPPSLPETK